MGYNYLKQTMQAQDPALNDFPEIDIPAVEKFANAMFTPYLFFRRHSDRVELTASCCMRFGEMDIPPRTVTTREMEIMYGEHNDYATCPWCGTRVKMKNISRLGQKKNLEEWHRLVVLSEKDGDIYARAFWLKKDYKAKLNEPPLFYMPEAYFFGAGRAIMWGQSAYTGKMCAEVLEGTYNPARRTITEPFSEGGLYRHWLSYAVYNEFAIRQSRFRYCEYENFQHRYYSAMIDQVENRTDLMKYLALCSIYPRQTEMLMKCGYQAFVCDMVIGRCKNSRAINWKADTPKDLLGLTKEELRELETSGAGIYSIEWYKYLKKAGLQTSFEDLKEIRDELRNNDKTLYKLCRKYNVKPLRVCRYLNKFTGHRCHGAGYMDTNTVFGLWKDYLHFADDLGWNLKEESVLLPKNLDAKHNEAAAEYQKKQEVERIAADAELVKKSQESLERRRKKYNFELGGYSIRIAETPAEILLEGAVLKHCVGGYAYRHMEGETTILFLRRCDTPAVSLYTIEMHGNRLQQIHGFKNDALASYGKQPRQAMKWMLDPWLDWIRAGSKRDKNGNPIIKQEVQKTA